MFSNSFVLTVSVTVNEIRDIINTIKPKPSKDVNGFKLDTIKMIQLMIVLPLTKLINHCIQKQIFPTALKKKQKLRRF